jgi:hypothetical protein
MAAIAKRPWCKTTARRETLQLSDPPTWWQESVSVRSEEFWAVVCVAHCAVVSLGIAKREKFNCGDLGYDSQNTIMECPLS